MVNRTDMIMRWLTVVLLLITVGVAFRAWQVYSTATKPDETITSQPGSAIVMDRPDQPVLPSDVWTSVVRGGEIPADASHEQYRLAGTFFLMGSSREATESGQRLAIIDDVAKNQQHIVSEGQSFDGHEIMRIHADRLLMRRDGVEIELTLSFRDGMVSSADAEVAPTNVVSAEETVLETSRFGKRIGEARWVMQKEALVGYYQELLEDPERIAAIYMSMKPDYIDGEIAGYRLEKEGEAEFFAAVGLQEGDRIRKVNSMNMTSQARAEYFISEFMKERLGAVVLDVERNGQPEKLIYLFR